MANSTLEKKLKKYSALAAATIAGVSTAQAQIGYTEVAPIDQNLGHNEWLNIDLNGDAVFDFQLGIYYTYSGTWYYNGTMVSTSLGGSTYSTTSSYYMVTNSTIRAVAVPYGSNQIIGSSSSWSGYQYLNALEKPNHISGSLSSGGWYQNDGYMASLWNGNPYGDFDDWGIHYLGVKFSDGTNNHYGWIRLRVNAAISSMDVFDYGYEQTPDASIHAGGVPSTFTDAGSGNWNDAANWDKGIPTLADDAVISIGQTVTLNNNGTCFNFVCSGGINMGSYTLDVGGHFTAAAPSFNEGTGTLNLTGDFLSDANRRVTCSALKAPAIHIYNITVNNANVSYIMDDPINIDNNFNVISDAGFDVQSVLSVENNLTIDGTLTNSSTLNEYGNMTVNGTFTNDGDFTLKSDVTHNSSLLDNGSIVGTGTFYVEKYLTDGRWWYLSSPMTDATADAFGVLSSTVNSGTRLFYYTESTGLYTAVTAGGDALERMRGYAYKNFDAAGPNTAVFTGTLANGPLGDLDNLSNTDLTPDTYEGYNLVGNPYPSALDLGTWNGSDATTSSGVTVTNLEPSIWFRSDAAYPTVNWTTGIGTLSSTQYCPAMQAFWLKVATIGTGTFNTDNTSRLHNSQAFFKEENESNVFRLEIMQEGASDETVIHFNENADENFDALDSRKMINTEAAVPQIYTLSTDQETNAINGEPILAINETRIIPLGVYIPQSGVFTFQASNLDIFDASIDVYLEDLQTGAFIDLRNTDNYTFTSGTINDASRFLLHFGEKTTAVPESESAFASAYSFNSTIYVNVAEPGSTIQVYDLLGNLITTEISASGLNKLQLIAEKGIYIVKVQKGTNLMVDKIIIE